MKNLLLFTLCFSSAGAFAQMQINKPIQLTGVISSDAKIEGIQEIVNNSDAANKIYVDTAIANRTSSGSGPEIRVFATSGSWNGNLGGLSGADAKCQAEADAASLGGTWIAYLSTSTVNAIDRVDNNTKIVNMLGETIAEYGLKVAYRTAGDVNLDYPVFYDATGTYTPAIDIVWTGTRNNGLVNAPYTCSDWTSTSGLALIGSIRGNNFTWNSWQALACNNLYRLYCFEQ